MFKELNPLLHSELRLAVMSLLIGVEEADFVFIRQQTPKPLADPPFLTPLFIHSANPQGEKGEPKSGPSGAL